MDLKEKAEHVVQVMKRTKDSWVATKPENTDLAIYLHFYRSDELVATVICPLDRDTGLKAGMLGAKGFNASTMAITFEGYHSHLPESPVTGKPWKHQEMQFMAQTSQEAIEKHWVNECLTTSVHERGGGFAVCSLSFIVRDDKVEWLGDDLVHLAGPEAKGDGVMFDYLQQSMNAPTVMEQIKSDGSPASRLMLTLISDPEAQLFHSDIATIQALKDKDLASGVVLSAPSGSDREQWITERFGPPAEA
jgi:hypothetical protein